MRLELPAIELTQTKGINVFLTKLSVKQVQALLESKQLIPQTYKPDIEEGYQRDLDPARMKKILNFLESKYKTVLPVMPSSIVLSVRKGETEPVKFKDGKVILGADATMYVVDGQHRVYGLRDYKNAEYEIPATILYGMNEHQEAAQFLVINSTQKKVDPSLQLRVLFYAQQNLMEDFIKEIKNVIPWDSWKLQAIKLAIDLEDDPENPWYKKIETPNDKSTEWKPIREGSFVDSLRYVSSDDNPIAPMETDQKAAYLKDYWNTIRKLWSKAFSAEDMDGYILVSPFGAGVFNTLFPSIVTMRNTFSIGFEPILQPVAKKYPLKSWARRTGQLSKVGTGHSAYDDSAENFLLSVYPKLDYTNHAEYDDIIDMKHNLKWLVNKAYDMLWPLKLRSSEYLKEDRGRYKKACYVLANLEEDGDVSVYVGHSGSVESRLKGHNKDFNLYYVDTCKDEQEMKQLEGTLWHLVKKNVRENAVHPNKDFCPFCG